MEELESRPGDRAVVLDPAPDVRGVHHAPGPGAAAALFAVRDATLEQLVGTTAA